MASESEDAEAAAELALKIASRAYYVEGGLPGEIRFPQLEKEIAAALTATREAADQAARASERERIVDLAMRAIPERREFNEKHIGVFMYGYESALRDFARRLKEPAE